MPEPPRRTGELVNLTLALAFSLTAVFGLVVGEWWAAAMFAGLAFLVFTSVRAGRLAWQAGYLNARSIMWRSLEEAHHRGLTHDEWIHGEAERDGIRLP